MERDVFLYKITNPKGSIYIGQTLNPRDRFIVYARNDTRSQHKLKNSIQKYGWDNHDCQIITSVPEGQADYAEKYLIAWYNSTDKFTGLNIMHGGAIKRTPEMIEKHRQKMIGRKHSDGEKQKRAISLKGNQNAKGSIRTEEFKKNASIKLTGFKRPENSNKHTRIPLRKPILSYTLDGKFIKEYASSLEVVIDGFDRSCVSKVCKAVENRAQHKGVIFKFKTP